MHMPPVEFSRIRAPVGSVFTFIPRPLQVLIGWESKFTAATDCFRKKTTMNRYVLQGTINQKVWNMISIKRLLENINEDREKKGKDLPVPPLRQMGSLLLDGMATHVVRG